MFRSRVAGGLISSLLGLGLCIACATQATKSKAAERTGEAPNPPGGMTGAVVQRWVPGTTGSFHFFPARVGGAVFDPRAAVVYAMTTQEASAPGSRARRKRPTDVEVKVIAIDLATGKQRWQSPDAAVPLAIEAGKLIALQAVRTAAPLVMLAPATGHPVGRCGSAQFTVGEWRESASGLRAVVHEGRTYLLNTRRTWYAGGMAVSAEEAAAARTQSTGVFALSTDGGSCSVTPVKEHPLNEDPAAHSAKALVLRRRGGSEGVVFSVGPASGAGPTFEHPAPGRATPQLSVDGRHLLLQATRLRSSPMVYEVTVLDVATGAVAATWELPFAVAMFVVHGEHVLASTGGVLVGLELKSGRQVWTHALPFLGYAGPYPP